MSLKNDRSIRALIYGGPGLKSPEERPLPAVVAPTNTVVRIPAMTICGTGLHMLKSDAPTGSPGRILGHEGVGVGDSSLPAESTRQS